MRKAAEVIETELKRPLGDSRTERRRAFPFGLPFQAEVPLADTRGVVALLF